MAQASDVKGIVHIISGSPDDFCSECRYGFPRKDTPFQEAVNHYLQAHAYKLLHVGQQTYTDDDGQPHHSTVAVLGK